MTSVNSPLRVDLLTKRYLVAVSHAVEHAALRRLAGEPALVIALFQRMPYFDRESDLYHRFAELTDVTVIATADPPRPRTPEEITSVQLFPDEELAREWAVVVLTPQFGAFVTATAMDEISADEHSLEAGRMFRGRWGFRRGEAYAEVMRLRETLGDRIPPDARAQIASVLSQVTAPPSIEDEERAEAAIRSTVDAQVRERIEAAKNRQQAEDERGHQRDPWTGLHTLASLRAYVGRSATGTLPVGLTLVRIDQLDGLAEQHGSRVGMHAENNVADLLRSGLRPIDRAVRLSKTEFLVVRPAVGTRELDNSARNITECLAAMHETYPFVDLSGRTTTLLTRDRPLPLLEMRKELLHENGATSGIISGHLSLVPQRWFS